MIKQRKNQVSLWGVCGKASVVNKIHASPGTESIKAPQIFNRESSVPRKIVPFKLWTSRNNYTLEEFARIRVQNSFYTPCFRFSV